MLTTFKDLIFHMSHVIWVLKIVYDIPVLRSNVVAKMVTTEIVKSSVVNSIVSFGNSSNRQLSISNQRLLGASLWMNLN